MPRIGKQKSPEEIAQWKAALDDGMSIKHVAETFGVHRQTVSRYFPDRAWTREQISRHGLEVKKFNGIKAGVLR